MKKLFSLFVIMAVISLSYFSAFSSEQINLSLDVCQFRFNADSSLVEVYYGLNCEKQAGTEKSTTNPFVISLSITKEKEQVVNNIWKVETQFKDSSGTTNHSLMIDVMRYLLPAGSYNFKLIARDLKNPDLIDSIVVKNIGVQTFGSKTLSMSGLELAQEITPATPGDKDRFYKNRFRVVPNPLTLYGEENNKLYYYFESYNLLSRFSTNFYTIKRSIIDSYGLPLAALPVEMKKKRIRGNDAAEVGMFDISAIPSGAYFVQFVLMDEEKNEVSSIQKRFFVHNPGVAPINRDILPIESQVASSEIALLSSEDVEMLCSVIHDYLGNVHEKKLVGELTTEIAKREFLYHYWSNHDEKKDTAILESLREVMKRIRYSNENFTQLKLSGWKTDRGRILITYGRPSEIQYYPNIADFKEFRAWSYDYIERGVVFIFGVLGGFGDMQLIHSTKTGEIRNDNWFDLIKVTAGMSGIADDMNAEVNRRETLREIFQRYNIDLPRYLK